MKTLKLRPETIAGIQQIIDENATSALDEKARNQQLKKIIRQFEKMANGSEDTEYVLFKESPDSNTFSLGYLLEVRIDIFRFNIVASLDDFYDVESSPEEKKK